MNPTLLHAILKNQQALAEAICGVANWIEEKGSPLEAHSVRESLHSVEENRTVIGRCLSELIKP